jgi:hypothetical protein
LAEGAHRAVRSANGLARLVVAGTLVVATSVQPQTRADEPHQLIRVGPQHAVKRIADAARQARDGAEVVIEPGDYAGDVATWTQNRLSLRAERCCVRLFARGRSAEGKAIWVIKGDDVVVDGIEFRGARVPHRNGAGIRHEGGRLVVRNSRFLANEMGLLTWNEARGEVVVERCEFAYNGVVHDAGTTRPVGHQIYVGRIGRFELRESHVHHGRSGHLVKSRAREHWIVNNRLTDEAGGRASYELEFPEGGIAVVVGNAIHQSGTTENSTMIAFGAETYRWPRNELYLVNNTLADDRVHVRPTVFVRPGSDALVVLNNLVVGRGVNAIGISMLPGAWIPVEPHDMPNAARHDYRLRSGSRLAGTAVEPPRVGGVPLKPEREYSHPRASRPVPAMPYSPGAMQSLLH